MMFLLAEVCASGADIPGGVYDVCIPAAGWERTVTSYPWLLAVWVGVMAAAIWKEQKP